MSIFIKVFFVGHSSQTVVAIVVPVVTVAILIGAAGIFMFTKKRTTYMRKLQRLESNQQSGIRKIVVSVALR